MEWTKYTTKEALKDNDELMILDKDANANKRTLMDKVWDYVVDKMTTAVIAKLGTTNKTLIGAVNELNSKTIKNTVGEFFSENTNINNVNFIANYGVMTVNIVTNIIDIKEDMILCTITERYKPASDIYTIGYIYDPKAFVQLVVDTHGNIKVFGKHTVKGKLRIFLTYVLR